MRISYRIGLIGLMMLWLVGCVAGVHDLGSVQVGEVTRHYYQVRSRGQVGATTLIVGSFSCYKDDAGYETCAEAEPSIAHERGLVNEAVAGPATAIGTGLGFAPAAALLRPARHSESTTVQGVSSAESAGSSATAGAAATGGHSTSESALDAELSTRSYSRSASEATSRSVANPVAKANSRSGVPTMPPTMPGSD